MLGIATSNREGIVLLVSVFSKYVVNTNVKDHIFMKEESNCCRSVYLLAFGLIFVPVL